VRLNRKQEAARWANERDPKPWVWLLLLQKEFESKCATRLTGIDVLRLGVGPRELKEHGPLNMRGLILKWLENRRIWRTDLQDSGFSTKSMPQLLWLFRLGVSMEERGERLTIDTLKKLGPTSDVAAFPAADDKSVPLLGDASVHHVQDPAADSWVDRLQDKLEIDLTPEEMERLRDSCNETDEGIPTALEHAGAVDLRSSWLEEDTAARRLDVDLDPLDWLAQLAGEQTQDDYMGQAMANSILAANPSRDLLEEEDDGERSLRPLKPSRFLKRGDLSPITLEHMEFLWHMATSITDPGRPFKPSSSSGEDVPYAERPRREPGTSSRVPEYSANPKPDWYILGS